MNSQDKQDKKENPKKIWYHFYYEPYFEGKEKEEFVTLLTNYIDNKTIKEKDTRKKGIDSKRRIKTQLDQEKQIQPDYFPILLPLLLLHKDFYESYLNVSLPHRRYFSNSQHLLTQSLAHLRILSYPQDNFYRYFVELTGIDKAIDTQSQNDVPEQLKKIKNIDFAQWKEWEDKHKPENIAPIKALLESKYKALWCNISIRYERYLDKNAEPEDRYEKIYKYVEEGIEALLKSEGEWDYDCAMLFLSLIGYTFLGTQGSGCAFMDLDEKLRERYIDAYKVYISPLKGTKNNDPKTCQIDIKPYKEKLQSHLSHPHIALYLDYYEFLYLQMQFEHIVAKNKTKNFQEFKEHLYKAQSHIDSLLTKYSAYHYFIMKFLKHRARIYEIIWHIEFKSLEFQVQSPFDFELKDSKNSILKESGTIAKYIDSFFGSKE